MRFSSSILTLALLASYSPVGEAQSDIRHVDFKNFTYSPSCIEKFATLRVKNGEYTSDTRSDPLSDSIDFRVMEVVYGDLTGDGAEEAVVVTMCSTGGTGRFTDGIIFTVGGGKTTEIGTLGIGDRADGGIEGVTIEKGLLLVRRHGTVGGPRCCPEYVETTTYRLTGNKLFPVGKPVRKRGT